MKRPWCLGGVGDEGVQLNKEHPLVRRLTADQRAEYLTEVACVESVNGIASQRQTVRTSTKVIFGGVLVPDAYLASYCDVSGRSDGMNTIMELTK